MLTLPNAVAEWGQNDFEVVLIQELTEQPDGFPLDGLCDWGGYPGDEVSVTSLSYTHDADTNTLEIAFMLGFTEYIPTSCSDLTPNETHLASIVLSLDLDGENAEAEFITVEPWAVPSYDD